MPQQPDSTKSNITSDFMPIYRVIVYIPQAQAKDYADQVSVMIPAFIGKYDKVCWWSAAGTGQFRPLDGANPAIGTVGDLEHVSECRMEFCIPFDDDFLARFIKDGARPHHPYEAPVIIVSEDKLLRP